MPLPPKQIAKANNKCMAESTPPKSRTEPQGKFSMDPSKHAQASNAHSIRVDVSASYVGEQSKPEESHYVFSYTITIRNEGQVPARLLTRHWVITDANGKVKEVRGEGVVGEQPYLLPGQGFRYSSGAVIETPVGAMQGSYQMLGDDGSQFDANIAPFTLAVPGLLH